MDELIDILTSEGKATGKSALKSEAHHHGWFHATVHIWLFTTDAKVLLQKRGLNKKVFPGLWDISVAGHIGAGESILTAAKREVFEEIGLQLTDTDFTKIATRKHQISHKNGIIDNEFHQVFIAELKIPLTKLALQETEVAAIELFDLTILKQTKNLHNVLLPEFHEYYSKVYDAINSKILNSTPE
jgi:isopentenyl-diphosphate delta-isomerase